MRVRLLLGKGGLPARGTGGAGPHAELLAHGVEIYEYLPSCTPRWPWWTTSGRPWARPTSTRSLLLNLEANVVLLDGRFAEQLRAEIETAQAASRQVTSPPHTGWRALLGRAWGPGSPTSTCVSPGRQADTDTAMAKPTADPHYRASRPTSRRGMASGRWEAGDLLPSEGQLTMRFKISRMTASPRCASWNRKA